MQKFKLLLPFICLRQQQAFNYNPPIYTNKMGKILALVITTKTFSPTKNKITTCYTIICLPILGGPYIKYVEWRRWKRCVKKIRTRQWEREVEKIDKFSHSKKKKKTGCHRLLPNRSVPFFVMKLYGPEARGNLSAFIFVLFILPLRLTFAIKNFFLCFRFYFFK